MAEPFELPEDVTALSSEELEAVLTDAVAAFEAKSQSTSVTAKDLDALRSLAAGVKALRAEKQARLEAAEQAAAEIDALAAEVLDTPAAPDVEETEPESEEATAEAEEGTESEPEPETVSASVVRRPALDLSGVRRRQPRQLPPSEPTGPEIIAAVDVPGYMPGQGLDMPGVTEGVIRRANALKTAGGGVGIVASYRLPFQNNLIVNDSSSAPEGTTALMAAADQSRLNGGDLVASGGWCAPSETVYEITDIACPDMLWDAPEIQMSRGGLRYFQTPSLDVSAMTFVHTEADDISGATKPCFKIPCPDPIEVRCDAVGVCLEAGILTQRHFPELVAWYQRNAMVAHEMRVRQQLFQQAVAEATPVTIAPTFAALSAIYAAVGLQAADMIERHSLCDRIGVEVVFPWWARNLFLADLARQNGVNVCDLNPGCLTDLFATLGVRVQFARGLNPAVPTEIGGPTPAAEWPAEINFLIYPTGAFQIGRGAEVNLGVIHDSNKFSTNDYTAIFSEECVALVNRGPEARVVTVPVCPDGSTGAQPGMICAGGSAGASPGASI